LSFRIHASPVFDPITGFGGDGVPGTYSLPPDTNVTSNRIFTESFKGCVGDGPFKDYTLSYGPGQLVTKHCLTRDIQDDSAVYLNSAAMANATRLPTYELFRIELEGEPITPDHKMHDGGHYGVGGEMSNFYSSPGGKLLSTPLFTR
jgi:tyrosinase